MKTMTGSAAEGDAEPYPDGDTPAVAGVHTLRYRQSSSVSPREKKLISAPDDCGQDGE
jgi:hypothetical protein